MGVSSTPMFAFAVLATVFAAAAARCPTYADHFAAALTLVATAAWDPWNEAAAAGSGHSVNASLQLAGYGSLPFVFGTLILPRIEVLAVSVVGHTVRSPPRRPRLRARARVQARGAPRVCARVV